jgi:hypothetical protein
MSEKAFGNNIRMLTAGIEACLEKKLIPPALILLYSSIDISAWLTCEDPKARVGKRFTGWVDRYMLPTKKINCTAEDLYGARCGFLHTLTAESDLSANGKARQISYAWGAFDVRVIEREIVAQGWAKVLVAVHVGDLFEAWRLGITALVSELQKDKPRAKRFFAKASKFFRNIDINKDGKVTKDWE